jgi:hypothetical protein
MRIVAVFVLLFCFGFAQNALAQVTPDSTATDDPLQQQIEDLSENTENEDLDLTTLEENLKEFLNHPLNLNTATREELESLLLLNEIQITNLLAHREQFGSLITIYELQAIDGFDLATIYKILPYVTVNDQVDSGHFSWDEMWKNGRNELVIRDQRVLESQQGYSAADSATLAANPNSRYLGSPDHLYVRYRFTYGNFVSAAFLADKDAGEEFFTGTQKQGFDFYSAHLCVRNIGFVKTAVIGDYQANFGQGLTAWTGYAFGKSSLGTGTKRNATGIRPYTSTDENKFMRGGAATVRFGKFESTAFFSMKYRDANIASFSDTTGGKELEALEVSSLQTTGLHTTPAEIADKDAIREILYGGNLAYKGKRFQFGVTAMYSEYSATLKRDLDLYNQFEFSARTNLVIGADYDYIFRNFHFFGEGARSANGGFAMVNGVLISLDPRLAFTVHHRWLDRNFQNLYASAFSENTLPANEHGIYFGITAKPLRRVTINAYVDRYTFPWMHYLIDAPSSGSDFLVQVNFTPDKKTDMYFRYRHRDKFTNANDEDAIIDYIVPLSQNNWRFQIQYAVGKSIRLRNRVEFSRYEKENTEPENGFAIWQDVTYKRIGSPVSFSLRYALFQTETYNARIYAYENDLPYTFSVPAYYYKGSRVYLLANWDVSGNFEIYFRIAQTVYQNQPVISEGSLTEIRGNTKTEAKLMLRFKF